jgi:hypothetical protein
MANFFAPGGAYGRRDAKLTTTNATTIVDGANAAVLVSLTCTEITGGVATLTIAIVNTAGTTVYLRNALAMTAKQTLILDTGWPLDVGDLVKVTASIADNIDVIAVVVERTQAT